MGNCVFKNLPEGIVMSAFILGSLAVGISKWEENTHKNLQNTDCRNYGECETQAGPLSLDEVLTGAGEDRGQSRQR